MSLPPPPPPGRPAARPRALALNESIWKSAKGRHARMPRPRHEHLIGSVPTDEGDER